MRVSFVADSDGWGGAEVWLTHHLRRAAACGATASLVCAEPVAPGFASLDVDRAVVPLTRHTAAAPATREALAAQRPDVVVVNLVDPASNAAAVGARSVTVFLPGDPVRWAHPGPRHRALTPTVPCAPCPHLACPIEFRCALTVSPAAVAGAARELAATAGR